jgi:hypothetical protein
MSHLTDDDLVLHYYGEVEAAGRADAQKHVDACGACRERFAMLQRVLATVDTVPVPALPDSFERTVWARLEPALPRPRGWFSWLLTTPPNLAWAAAVVILIAGAFFAGRLSRTTTPAAPVMTAEQLRESVLLADLSEHLDRSQTMLVELVSEDPSATGGGVDISLERDVAGELVAANRLYRQAVVQSGDTKLEVLVEIAASPNTLAAEDMDRVRQRIAAKDLLFKVRVVSSTVREKQEQRIRSRAGQSS